LTSATFRPVPEAGFLEIAMFGPTELIIILILVLVIFGAGKLPEIGGALGKGIRSFKKAVREPDETDITPKDEKKEDKK
jgi:sec-independent protein translocase protein TatA